MRFSLFREELFKPIAQLPKAVITAALQAVLQADKGLQSPSIKAFRGVGGLLTASCTVSCTVTATASGDFKYRKPYIPLYKKE